LSVDHYNLYTDLFSRIKFNPFKTKTNPNYIKGFSSYHATKTLQLGYRGQSANAEQRNKRRLSEIHIKHRHIFNGPNL